MEDAVVVAVDSTFTCTGVVVLVIASRVSFVISAPSRCSGWKIGCGVVVGDKYKSATAIAAAALARTWWNCESFGPITPAWTVIC